MEQTKIISCTDIAPFVRYVQKYQPPYHLTDSVEFLTAYDHRLFYVYHGDGLVEFRDHSFRITRGDVLLWPSGWDYRLTHSVNGGLLLLGCNFDYKQRYAHAAYPIPPDASPDFQPNLIHEYITIKELPATSEPICLHNMEEIKPYLELMLQEYQTQLVFFQMRLSGLLKNVLSQIFRSCAVGSPSGTMSSDQVNDVIEYIKEHYNEPISNSMIGEHFNYHPNYLNKQMVQHTSKSIHQYLITYRITQAVNLLENTDMPVSAIAAEVGFGDVCHFSRIFHQRTGQAPGNYRRCHKRK